MITPTKGNILQADAEALVNTVNCVGIMGRGIAAQFKVAYPANFTVYKRACDRGEVQPGHMLTVPTGSLTNPRFIINFPTKRHWKGKSRIEDIETGLIDLKRVIRAHGIYSIAIPPLGAGLGGLNWTDVKPRIISALADLADLTVLLYEPTDQVPERSTAMNLKPPTWTAGRAMMVSLMEHYESAILDPFLSLLEVHKLLYLAQVAGEPLKLTFEKGLYGPYGKEIRHVLNATEGYMTSGYDGEGDNPNKSISLVPGATKEAAEYLSQHHDKQAILDRVERLVDGWETPYGLELLTTVHWVVKQEGAQSEAEAVAKTHAWSERKKKFTPRQIGLAHQQLARQGWI